MSKMFRVVVFTLMLPVLVLPAVVAGAALTSVPAAAKMKVID